MTRSLKFKGAGKDYANESVSLSKLNAFIMGNLVEPARDVIRSIGQTLDTGCTRALQFASKAKVTAGKYLQQQAYAYANIAGQTCKGPKPAPG